MITLPCRKPDLYNYSPHQGPMLLLDQVDRYDLQRYTLESSVCIKPDSEFYNNETGNMPIWISFEYMAQSIAALSGIASKLNSQNPKIGFIVGIRGFESFRDGYKPEDIVTIKVSQNFREGDVAVFDGETYVNDVLYSIATLNVVENNPELLDKWRQE